MKKLITFIQIGLVGTVFAVGFNGCSAMSTAIEKRNLDVQTKMSSTIFLEPVAPSKRVIYVDIRNTSDKDLNISNKIKAKLKSSGYTITDNPENAHYMLQANILKVGKSDLRSSRNALEAGFGGAVLGGAIGSVSHSSSRRYYPNGINSRESIIGAIAGSIIGTVGDAIIKDILYVMITDLQLKERPTEGEVITQIQNTSATSGTATTVNQTVSGGKAKWKMYRTRIVSTANKVNLDFKEAQSSLENGLVKSIGGIF